MTDRLAFSDAESEQMAQDKQIAEMEDKELAEAMARSANDPSSTSSSSTQSLPLQSSGSAASAAGRGLANIPEESIQRIVDLGFTRNQALLELQRSNGNVDVAAAALIARSFPKPPVAR